jgi:hypothetical protein
MADFVTLHLFNVAPGREDALRRFVDADTMPQARTLRGMKAIDLHRRAPVQLQVEARQPWTHAMVYEAALATPEIDLPALAPVLAGLRDAGLVAADGAERIHSYAMYHPWKYSANLRDGPLSHLMFLLANFVPGHEAEYHRWYDEVHSVEVSESPGYVGMRRGRLAAVQVPPGNFCPGSELILGGIQTDDLAATLKEFYDRAMGLSPSGIAWGPRSGAGSLARTVHIFERLGGWSA